MRCSFLINARSSTLTQEFYEASRCGGYLFPPDAATRAIVANLSGRKQRWVLSDNGAFDNIARIAQTGSAITGADRWNRVLAVLREASAVVDSSAQLDVQLSVSPDAIVGSEDITLAVWLRAGVDESLLRRRRQELASRNRRVAERGLALQQQLPDVPVLTVASAHDYDSAYDAGQALATAGVRAAAIGFGAFMADDQWGQSVKIRGRTRALRRSLPMRYLRTALVSRGFFDGWATLANGVPDRFHYLGLGAPVMLPVAVLPARRCPDLTLDATSPLKDAVEGSLYVSRPAALKVRTWKVADRLAGPNPVPWSCPCQFCGGFLQAHPFDLPLAQQVRAASTKPFTAADLRVGTPLGKALPLFRIASDRLGREAELARIGHNHWVLGTLARAITRQSAALEELARGHVERYEAHAGAPHFAEAVRMAFEITRPDGNFWN